MSNVYDHAYSLEKAVRETDAFKQLKTSFESVMNDEGSKELFNQFRDTQVNLQEKQMSNQEISEAELEEARSVVEAVQQHESISQLMESEQQLNVMINDISKIIMKPLEDLYGASLEEE